MLKRRSDYGTSEAILYGLHGEKKKTIQVPSLQACSFMGIAAALLMLSMLPLLALAGSFAWEAWAKMLRVRKRGVHLGFWRIIFSVGRSHFSFFYFTSFHLIRYYMAAIICLGFIFHPLWYVLMLTLLLSSSVDYCLKRPQLNFLQFIFYYVADHLSYQLGVFGGCVRERSFGSYSVKVMKKAITHYVQG
jgi:hypothetical protein